jgi:hypothetical protein
MLEKELIDGLNFGAWSRRAPPLKVMARHRYAGSEKEQRCDL